MATLKADMTGGGDFTSGGQNLIGRLNANATGFGASDLTGTDGSPLDPKLLLLAWYGGRTKTHALHFGSPAMNAGDNTDAPPTDQRGYGRIAGGTIDIGSVEMSVPTPPGGPFSAKQVKSKLATPPPLTSSQKPVPTPPTTTLAKRRGIPTAAQVEQFGKAAIHQAGDRLGLSLIPIAEPPGLELTL